MLKGVITASGKTDLVVVPNTLSTEVHLKILNWQLLEYYAPYEWKILFYNKMEQFVTLLE